MSSSSQELLQSGHYARKQIFSRNPIVAWSHRRRFAVARELAAAGAGGALLDYGCGDGTFVAMAHELFRETVGADIEIEQLRDCSIRLADLRDVRFASIDALRDPEYHARFDAVVCMEVLEHCPSDIQPQVLSDLDRVVRPHGVVVLSVPIEIGPTLAVKQLVRAAAATSGLTEYDGRERYHLAEFMRMVLAGETSQVERPITTSRSADGAVLRFHGHKGFNWRALERLIERNFVIERRLYSPLPLTRSWLNSQVWFVCRKR